MITKNNRRLKGGDEALNSIRRTFEKIRAAWAEKNGVWIAVDFEAWEMDHKDITEFGWSKLEFKDGEEIMEEGHIIVAENKTCYNGKYVPDNQRVGTFGNVLCLWPNHVTVLQVWHIRNRQDSPVKDAYPGDVG